MTLILDLENVIWVKTRWGVAGGWVAVVMGRGGGRMVGEFGYLREPRGQALS